MSIELAITGKGQVTSRRDVLVHVAERGFLAGADAFVGVDQRAVSLIAERGRNAYCPG